MSEAEAPEPDQPAGGEDVGATLFGRWEVSDIVFSDPSTERYITLSPVAHTMGRHASKQFQKSEISIVERLINRLMKSDTNTGKKQKSMSAVQEALGIVYDRTEQNPVQVLVEAVENAAPREETVRLKYGGISVPKAVDVAPQRRVDQAVRFLADGTYQNSFKTATPVAEALASQLIGAAQYDVGSYAINQKEEQERVAAAAR